MPDDSAVIPAIRSTQDEFIAIRQRIHAHPELGFEEIETSTLVAGLLCDWGYEVTTGIGGTGLVGRLTSGSSARTLGIRADMDALPIQEATGLPYASKIAERMHACGHDGHTAILLAAARYLAETRNFDGTLNLIFQPAEEGLGGASRMMEDGLFERFPCEAVFALHNAPGVPVGKFALRTGAMAASADHVLVTLRGKGAHGAMPHFGQDPIVAAASIVMALQTIVSRNVPATETAVVTVGMLHAGTANNVIPETASLELTVRALDREVRELLEKRIRSLVQRQAESFDVVADIDYRPITRVVVNTEKETAFARRVLCGLVGAANVIDMPTGLLGSEDFSWMLERVPGCYLLLGNGIVQQGGCMIHNPGYDFNDAALPLGASFWARLVEEYLAAS